MRSPPHVSDDEISITSTAPSEHQDEYEVENVLAERQFDGEGTLYLVKWAGYPLERCNWEPEESFCDPQTLKDWAARKDAISQNKEEPFDVDALTDRITALDEEKVLRQKRRKEKRIRLGIPVSPSSSSGGSGDESSLDGFIVADEGDEVPRKSRKKKRTERAFAPEDNRSDSPDSLFDEPPGAGESPRKQVHGSGSRPRPSATKGHPTSKNLPSRPSSASTSQPAASSRPKHAATKAVPALKLKTPATSGSFVKGSFLPAQDRSWAMSGVGKKKQQDQHSTFGGERFRNLSTQNRHEKYRQREPTPNILQLDIRAPKDWEKRQGNPGAIAQSPAKNQAHGSDIDSLFVEQDSPSSNQVPLPNDDSTSYQRDFSRRGSSNSLGLNKGANSTKSAPPAAVDKPMASGPQPPNWRARQHGDVLVDLKLGAVNMSVGDVRLCGLNRTYHWLVKLRKKNYIMIDFRNICTIDEYSELCKSGYQMLYASGWAVGYDDTAPALSEVTKYLRDHDLAALWYHPEDEAQLVLVAYASGSPSWSFLDGHVSFPTAEGLRVAARGTLPPLSSIRNVGFAAITPQQHQVAREKPSASTYFSFENGAIADTSHSPPTPQAPIIVPENVQTQPSLANADTLDIDAIFRERYGITFEELAAVKSKSESRALAFYLHFPEEPPEVNIEFEYVKNLLERHGFRPYTNRGDKDWDLFLAVRTGTILFHQNFIFYENMPQLNNLLLKPVFNIFNISLNRCIEGLGKSHLQRLFPQGGVVLMTEDLLVHETANALAILEWFGGLPRTTSNWKIFFRPNIQQWLLNLFDTWADDKLYQIYCWIKHLIPEYPVYHYNYGRECGSPDSLDGLTDDECQHHPFISTRNLPNYGSRSETEHEGIPKGLSQEQRDTDHLIEYFAGWSLMNCHKYRKFYVLTHFKPHPRWLKWNHLMVMNGEKFLKHLNRYTPRSNRSHKQPLSNPTSTSSPSTSRPLSENMMRPPPAPTSANHGPSFPVTSPSEFNPHHGDKMDLD